MRILDGVCVCTVGGLDISQDNCCEINNIDGNISMDKSRLFGRGGGAMHAVVSLE